MTDSIALSRRQVREVDRLAIERLGIPGIVLMENAGRHAAQIVLARASDASRNAVICGKGNNGGDGFVIARHLANARRHVEIVMTCPPSELTGDAATNHRIARNMRISMHTWDAMAAGCPEAAALAGYEVVIDALLGTGFSGTVRPPLDAVIRAINASGGHVIAVDVPSGLDADSGAPADPTVRADETVTFVARKVGFDAAGADAFTGRVHVADIGAPPWLIDEVVAAGDK